MNFYLNGLIVVVTLYSSVYGLIKVGYEISRERSLVEISQTISQMDTREPVNLEKAKKLLEEIKK